MKDRAEKVLGVVMTLVFLGMMAAKISSRPSDSPEKRSTKEDQPVQASQPRLVENFGKLPLRFEINQGQTDSQVRFLSRGSGYTMFLTGNEAVLSLNKPSAASQQRPISRRLPLASSLWKRATDNGSPLTDPFLSSLIRNPELQIQNPPAPSPESLAPAVLRMKLVGANPKAKVVGLDELPGKSNYFIGNDPKKWRTNVSNYSKVKYQSVYPGIDLVYYGNQGKLEHDFVVSPGANPGVIKLAIDGAEGISVDEGGNVVARLDGGNVVLSKPTTYQNTSANPKSKIENPKSVAGRFVLLASNQIGFEVANYKKELPLIIDPVLSYSTYLGGSSDENGNGIAVDSSGNAYVTGITTSTNFPTANPLQATKHGSGNVFVAKLNPAGSALVYSTYLGGSTGNNDLGYGIAVDSSGNAYVTGGTTSTDFPTVNPLQATNHGGADAFVAKLNATGSALVYSTYLGGSGYNDVGYGIAVDSSGNAYVTGSTESTDFPTVNPLQATYHSAFVAKLNATGSALVYSTYLGGSGGEGGTGIAVDSSGNAYVTGYTSSPDFPTVNPVQATHHALEDVFVAKLNATGSALVYSTYLGGKADDYGSGIAVDSSGNAYVTGETGSTDFPAVNPLQGTLHDTVNAFVAKLNATGSALVYSTYLGGSSADYGIGIAVDSSGNAYVTGLASSPDFPTVNPLQATNHGSTDAFVAKLNAAGSALVYSTYLGGISGDYGNGIAVDSSGNAYVTGNTASTDFPTANPLQGTNHGSADAFVAKISAGGAAPSVSPSPISLTFGPQSVGSTSAPQTETVTNAGTANLTISTVTMGGTNASDFAKSADTCTGATVTPNSTCTVSVTFTPSAAGSRSASLNFTDNASDSPQTVGLTGTGAAVPVAGVSPASLTFGSQSVGTASASQPVTLSNTGNAALTITSTATSANFGQTNNCAGSVAASSSCTISVTFSPTATGTLSGTLTITDNASNSPQTVTLSGSGTGPWVSFSTSSLSFGNQALSTASAAQAETVTNTGTTSLTIATVTLGGANSSDFAKSADTCTGATVTPNSTCTVSVTFTPSATGSRSASLNFTDTAANSPQTVSLTGTGTASAVSLSSSSLTFAAQMDGTSSAAQTVTLTNTGSASLTISSITASGDFSQTNTCGTSVSAGANCTISVTFKPTAVGTRTGTLSISDNAADSPQSVALSGTGQDFTFAPPSGSPTSVTVTRGQPATYTLSVGGQGGMNQNVSFTCTGAPSEANCTVSPNPATAGSSPTNVTVTVTTTAASISAPRSRPFPPVPPLSPGLRGMLMLALALAAMAWGVGRRNQPGVSRWRSTIVPLASGLLLAMALAGCGGGGGGGGGVTHDPGTPSGTYTLTVTGTAGSGSSTLSHPVTLTLIVS